MARLHWPKLLPKPICVWALIVRSSLTVPMISTYWSAMCMSCSDRMSDTESVDLPCKLTRGRWIPICSDTVLSIIFHDVHSGHTHSTTIACLKGCCIPGQRRHLGDQSDDLSTVLRKMLAIYSRYNVNPNNRAKTKESEVNYLGGPMFTHAQDQDATWQWSGLWFAVKDK